MCIAAGRQDVFIIERFTFALRIQHNCCIHNVIRTISLVSHYSTCAFIFKPGQSL